MPFCGKSKEFSLISHYDKKCGFTLAEVLITLGIIGVVAAMTLPALVSHYKSKELSTALKKFYSEINQAITLSVVQNGDIAYWDKEVEKYDENGISDKLENASRSEKFFLKYLAPYLKYNSTDKAITPEDGEELKQYELKINMADGSILYLHNGGCLDMVIDLNGNKNPNKSGRDQFTFVICPNAPDRSYWCGTVPFCSYAKALQKDRATALMKCKDIPSYCSTLLMFDDWEFKKDYPYKL